jgi:dTDP-4-amino-4,6-dideoxygalactose transaminase
MTRKIPFFNYPDLFNGQREELLPVITGVLERGAYIMQEDLFKFEVELANFLDVKHAIGVADGTMALVMSLRAAGIGEGDEVIVPSHTFVASAAAIHHVGATPMLADCGRDHLITADSILDLLSTQTKAIMPVQLNGRTANMDGICSIAEENNLCIIEDSAQALGSSFKNTYAGTFGVAGTFSFYPSKTLGCFGDGGAIITNDDKIAEELILLRDHGRTVSGEVTTWGYNSRLDNLQAAILSLKLKSYADSIERRRTIARIYHSRLARHSSLILPPGPDDDKNHFYIYQNYEIESDDRDRLQSHLAENGIGTILQWGGWMIHQFKNLNLTDSDLNFTSAVAARMLLLPMNTSLSDGDVNYICDKIDLFL